MGWAQPAAEADAAAGHAVLPSTVEPAPVPVAPAGAAAEQQPLAWGGGEAGQEEDSSFWEGEGFELLPPLPGSATSGAAGAGGAAWGDAALPAEVPPSGAAAEQEQEQAWVTVEAAPALADTAGQAPSSEQEQQQQGVPSWISEAAAAATPWVPGGDADEQEQQQQPAWIAAAAAETPWLPGSGSAAAQGPAQQRLPLWAKAAPAAEVAEASGGLPVKQLQHEEAAWPAAAAQPAAEDDVAFWESAGEAPGLELGKQQQQEQQAAWGPEPATASGAAEDVPPEQPAGEAESGWQQPQAQLDDAAAPADEAVAWDGWGGEPEEEPVYPGSPQQPQGWEGYAAAAVDIPAEERPAAEGLAGGAAHQDWGAYPREELQPPSPEAGSAAAGPIPVQPEPPMAGQGWEGPAQGGASEALAEPLELPPVPSTAGALPGAWTQHEGVAQLIKHGSLEEGQYGLPSPPVAASPVSPLQPPPPAAAAQPAAEQGAAQGPAPGPAQQPSQLGAAERAVLEGELAAARQQLEAQAAAAAEAERRMEELRRVRRF